MSIATRLGDWGGQGHVGEQAEAGGACRSEHCSCWSHAELRHPPWEVSTSDCFVRTALPAPRASM